MYRIMIVEDDDKILGMIKERLIKYNYQVLTIDGYDSILEVFLDGEVDLVLLDINLPRYDGFYWCKEIRKISKVPIIFVSARFSDMDQVMAIEKGGDDYIVKPFSFDLLLAKIKSLLRRTYGEYRGVDNMDVYKIMSMTMYRNQSSIEYCGRKIELSPTEFKLLDILIKNINIIVSREEILEELWDDVDFVDDNTLSVNMARLRRQLERLGIESAIETKRGKGYLMNDRWGDRIEC